MLCISSSPYEIMIIQTKTIRISDYPEKLNESDIIPENRWKFSDPMSLLLSAMLMYGTQLMICPGVALYHHTKVGAIQRLRSLQTPTKCKKGVQSPLV